MQPFKGPLFKRGQISSDRSDRVQVAALCVRDTKDGLQVLLITSRDTGRWIVPKGWPVEGKNGPQSALQEAWEEAGVSKADISATPLGGYRYAKALSDGRTVPLDVVVYLAQVRNLKSSYPEADERNRKWVSPEEAAELVSEPDLKAILRNLEPNTSS